MEIRGSLNVAENALRDLIEIVLRKKYGEAWFERLGVTEEKIDGWRKRREEEPKRRPGGEVEQRLLYYSDFYDALNIIKKNWNEFKDCFGDKKRFEVFGDRLAAFRNPDAHSRDLLPFEEQLVLGMTGHLRQEIAMFLSRGGGGAAPEYYPRIEEVRDNFGLRVVGKAMSGRIGESSKVTLKPGDTILFSGQAWDPDGSAIKWRINILSRGIYHKVELDALDNWEWQIDERDIGQQTSIAISIFSSKSYHRYPGGIDDSVMLFYTVAPR